MLLSKEDSPSLIPSGSFKNGIAGSLAGILTKSTTQPLDFLRTRLQVHDEANVKLMQLINEIRINEGMMAFYRGLSANLLGSGVQWGVYFFTYESCKNFCKSWSNEQILKPSDHFFCGIISGISAIIITNPIWLIKTRLQVQDINHPQSYNGILDCALRVYKEEGILKFYRGIVPALVLTLNSAIQFTIYEKLKILMIYYYFNDNLNYINIDKMKQYEHQFRSYHWLFMGAFSKICSTSITYPMAVIRARLFQNSGMGSNINKYNGISDCISKIWQKQGFCGYYRGLSAALLKTVPSSALTFMFYENILWLLNS